MSYLSKLKAEILLPTYNGMTDQEIVDSLNDPIIPKNLSELSGQAVLDETNWTEFASLSDLKKNQWLTFTSHDNLTTSKGALSIVRDIFGLTSTTETALLAARVINISRADQLGFPVVNIGDVINARLN